MTIPSELLNAVHYADCFDLLARIPDASIDLIATDPPYNGVKDDEWDNQWKTDADYLDWIKRLLAEFKRVLKPNGSLYLFASPRMAARVEVATGDYFNVINQIRWLKRDGWHKKTDEEILRGYLQPWEAVIFAEHYGSDKPFSDALIDGNATYWQACESAKVTIIGDYLNAEFSRAGVTRREIAALFPSATGGLTGCVSNWLLGYNIPTPQQYQAIREYLNGKGGDYLRREYEDLRREYEDLRRPFNASEYRPYTDVWEFKTVNTYEGKHPCEKPYTMMEHIILTSSRPGDVVLDCFAGSGATGDAASRNDRRYILCDADSHWCNYARKRVSLPYNLPLFASTEGGEP